MHARQPLRAADGRSLQQQTKALDGPVEGQVVLQYPERLSLESFEDFESWLLLVIRKAKRSVRQEDEDDADE
jgi:hypothetical protein